MTKQATADRVQALETLSEMLNPGDTVYCVLRHVAPSGMSRWIDLYVMRDDEPRWISWHAAKLLDYSVNTNNHDGVKMTGAGMDMGFALVYSLSQSLFPDGFACIGDKCPSNDHSNGDRDYTPGHTIHRSGGYALHHRWL